VDENADPKKMEHQIELAERAASIIADQTTAQRLRAFANDLRQMLQRAFRMRRRKQEIRTRAYELWEQAANRR
jgi:rRNA maturation protein Rpf1